MIIDDGIAMLMYVPNCQKMYFKVAKHVTNFFNKESESNIIYF